MHACTRAYIHDIIRAAHGILVVLHHDQGIAQIPETAQRGQQLVVFPRLRHEVRSPGLDGLHGFVRVGVGRHHDHHGMAVQFQDFLQAVHALLSAHGVAGEVHVQQYDVRPEVGNEMYDTVGRAHDLDFLRVGFKQEMEGEEHVFVVVYDEYFS